MVMSFLDGAVDDPIIDAPRHRVHEVIDSKEAGASSNRFTMF